MVQLMMELKIRDNFLLRLSLNFQIRYLLAEVSQLSQPFIQIKSLSNVVLIKLLLYGDEDLSDSINNSP